MIISCPKCSTSFKIPPAVALDIASNGKLLKCSSCQNEWKEGPYDDSMDEIKEDKPQLPAISKDYTKEAEEFRRMAYDQKPDKKEEVNIDDENYYEDDEEDYEEDKYVKRNKQTNHISEFFYNFFAGYSLKYKILSIAVALITFSVMSFMSSHKENVFLSENANSTAINLVVDKHNDFIEVEKVKLTNIRFLDNNKASFDIEGEMINTHIDNLAIPHIKITFFDRDFNPVHLADINVDNYLIRSGGKLKFTNKISNIDAKVAYVKIDLE